MKLQSAVKVWLLAAAAAVGPVWSSLEEETIQHQRNLKEQAIKAVERLLWVFSKEGNKDLREEVETTRVLWNGKHMLPLDSPAQEDERPITRSLHNEDAHAGEKGKVRVGRIGRSRKNRRRRNAKASKTSEKDKIPKSLKGGLQVIQKKVKGSKAGDGVGAVEVVLCFKGKGEDVTSACAEYNAGCCVGNDACAWNDDNDNRKTTVCQGACYGDQSCKDIGPGSYVSENSCRITQACEGMAKDSSFDEPAYVGPDSCVGEYACANMCKKSGNCLVRVGGNSCVDPNEAFGVCSNMAGIGIATEKVIIGSDSCLDNLACYAMGAENDRLESVEIDRNSCNEKESCAYIASKSMGREIDIASGACTFYRSCFKLGYYTREVNIKKDACQDYRSCEKIGFNAAEGTVSVASGACVDERSCLEVGLKTSQSVTVEADSCIYDYACFGVGKDVTNQMVLIGEQACNSNFNECSGMVDASCYTTANIRRGGTSC